MVTNNPAAQRNEIPCSLDVTSKPSNWHLARLVEQLAVDVHENRNDTQLLLDQRLGNLSANAWINRCFFCWLTNAHQWGTINCPDAQAMVKEGFCIFRDGHVFMADNSEFPSMVPGENMAAAIRSRTVPRHSPATGTNKIPLRTPQVSYVHVIDECDPDLDHVGASHATCLLC